MLQQCGRINALLIGLQLAHEMGVRYLKAYGDSKLIVNQVKGEYEVRHEDLVPYYHAVIEMANLFDGFTSVTCLDPRTLWPMLGCISNNASLVSRHQVSPYSGDSTPCLL